MRSFPICANLRNLRSNPLAAAPLLRAFCEDRGLLPAESLKRAFEHRDPYDPNPLWQNFRGLFRAIDEGNAGLNIPAYNGGLFASDPALDALQVPDRSAVTSRTSATMITRTVAL